MSNFFREMEDAAWNKFEQRIEAGKKLLPTKNEGYKTPRVCGSCKFLAMAGGAVQCVRPDGPGWDAGDLSHWFYTCDRWSENA